MTYKEIIEKKSPLKHVKREILYFNVVDITPYRQRILNMQPLRKIKEKTLSIKPIIPCIGQARRRCKIMKKTIDPIISPMVTPSYLTNIVVHVSSQIIEGDMVLDFDHYNGVEGKICQKREYEDTWSCSIVPKTADLFDNLMETVGDFEDIQAVIDHILNTVEYLKVRDSTGVKCHWVTPAFWDVYFYYKLIDLLLGGDFTVSGYTTLTAYWKNVDDSILYKILRFEYKARLPIEGDIIYTG